MRSSTLCAVLLTAFATRPALSAEAAGVTVLQLCVDGALSGFANGLIPELATFGSTSWRLIGDAPPCNEDDGAQRRATLASGRAAFDTLEVDRAVQVLRTLMSDIETSPRLDRDLPIALEAQLLLGWVAIERHDTSAARGYLEAVCALDPKWRPRATDFPPHVLEEHRRVCAATASTGAVRVDSAAKVKVDKRSCDGPCELRLVPGQHFVSIEANHVRRDSVVTVTAGESLLVTATLEPTTAERARISLRDRSFDDVRLVMTMQDTNDVVVIDRSGSELAAVVGHAPFADVRGPVLVEAQHPQRWGERIKQELGDLHERQQAAASVKPVWRRWWFWTAAGVVVTGAVVGIVAANSGTDHVTIDATLP